MSSKMFSTQGKQAAGAAGVSSDDEDEVFFFNSQMNNLTFVSDDEDAGQGTKNSNNEAPDNLPQQVRRQTQMKDMVGKLSSNHEAPAGERGAGGATTDTDPTGRGQRPAMSALSPEALSGVGFINSSSTSNHTAPANMNALSPSAVADGDASTPYRPPAAMSPHTNTSPRVVQSSLNPNSPSYTLPSPSADGSTYAGLMNPPTNAMALDFRRFYAMDEETAAIADTTPIEQLILEENVPEWVRREESAGIFMGQLPASYTETDIKLLLKSLARLSDFPLADPPAEGDGERTGDGDGEAGKKSSPQQQRKRYVEIRDVKCHARDKTCAFIMINASSLMPILDFSKRVLCDVNCVFVCGRDKKADIPNYISRFPRDYLKGVPKAALVLEKLTPQTKGGNRDRSHQQQQQHHNAHGQGGMQRTSGPPTPMYATSPFMGMGGGMQPTGMMGGFSVTAGQTANLAPMPGGGFQFSPLGGRVPNPTAPAFVPASMLVGGGAAGGNPNAVFMTSTGGTFVAPFGALPQQHQQQLGLMGYPQTMHPSMVSHQGASGVPGGASDSNTMLRSNAAPFVAGSGQGLGVSYLDGSNSIASMEAANQVLLAASRSRLNSTTGGEVSTGSHQGERRLSTSSSNAALKPARSTNTEEAESGGPPTPSASRIQPVSLAPTMKGVKCSCKQELMLSQITDPGRGEEPPSCHICKKEIEPSQVICYTCPNGHVYVCSLCGLKHTQRLREKQERLAQEAAKPKFTLVGLDIAGEEGTQTGSVEANGGDAPGSV